MRLPLATAEQSLGLSPRPYEAARAPRPAGGVQPQFDPLCALSCAGTTALGCLHCLTDVGCWISCAGPNVVGCITGCF